MREKTGTLYIVATPIGNLEDITLRAIRILNEVDIIAAEDTRQTLKLLNHYNIKKHLISYHANSNEQKAEYILQKLIEGQNIALVSDAGTPLISDPGCLLVKLCISNDVSVSAIPGPCALVVALSLSGIDTSRFVFEGFLPVNKRRRSERIKFFKDDPRTIVLYEAPHKLARTLQNLFEVLGKRNISIARELTKKFEEIDRTNLKDAICKYQNARGEIVLIIEGVKVTDEKELDMQRVKELLALHIENGLTKSDSIKKVAVDMKVSKKEIYAIANSLYKNS